MKKISLILCLFGLIFSSCDTDFDVNAPWKETTVVYGLLDPGKELQQIRISKAFLGGMDALQMAQYSDSTNYPIDELEVKVYRMGFNTINDSVTLIPSQILIDGGVFNDDVVVYEFHTDSFNLQPQYIYQLAIRNLRTNNKVTAETEVITNFSFTNNPDPFQHQFGQTYRFAFYNDVTGFKDKTVAWDRVNNGTIYQLDFVFNYNEDGESKNLVWRQGKESYTGGEMQTVLEGEKFFNFLSLELGNETFEGIRTFDPKTCIDLVMVVGTEDLDTYMQVNEPISGIVQERPQFTNINNGVGIFSSRFTYIYEKDLGFNTSTKDYILNELDLNFQ